MSKITIQCRLASCEFTRRQLWELMAEKNTPLINELLKQISKHPDFEAWRQKGKLPTGLVFNLCNPLKTDPRFIGQSYCFYHSAIITAERLYKSLLALQKKLQSQLAGQTLWLEIFKSDAELVEATNCSLDTLRIKAAGILAQLANSRDSFAQNKKCQLPNTNRHLADALFEAYRNTENTLTRSCISYLLKNGCRLNEQEEDMEKFTKRHRQIEIRIERLRDHLARRIPQGRDLTNLQWLETLEIAARSIPKDELEAKSWQASLLKTSSYLPFPIIYEASERLIWFKNKKGRICMQLIGLGKSTFEVYCDSRQFIGSNAS